MHGVNFDVIKKTASWLGAGDHVWFVTIVQTWGASPRPVGSLFAYNPAQNAIAGSLSGGCIEEDLISQLEDKAPCLPFHMRFGDSPEEQKRFQLPCGGSIELVVECLAPTALEDFKQIESRLNDRGCIERTVDFSTGSTQLELVPQISAKDQNVVLVSFDQTRLKHVLGPQYHLLIVGGGEICRYLIPLVQSLDFAITVCDPRAEVLERTSLADLDIEIVAELPDDLVTRRFTDPYSAIVALSHDPRVDDMALMAALETEAYYIGAMGSQRTTDSRLARLSSLGLSDENLAKLHAPVGLDIGSKTPPEIAISVAAELIKTRTGNKT